MEPHEQRPRLILKQRKARIQAVLPRAVRHWELTTLRGKLIKIGAKVVRHARSMIFPTAAVAVPRQLFGAILEGMQRLRLPPAMVG